MTDRRETLYRQLKLLHELYDMRKKGYSTLEEANQFAAMMINDIKDTNKILKDTYKSSRSMEMPDTV
jgi:hypothetical protein